MRASGVGADPVAFDGIVRGAKADQVNPVAAIA